MTVLFPRSQVKRNVFYIGKFKCIWSIEAPKNWLSYNKLLLVSGQYSYMIVLASEGNWIHDNIGSFLSITADSNLVAEVMVFAGIWMKKLYLQPRCRLHSVWSVSREQSSSLAQMWSTREPLTHLGYDSSSPPNPWKRRGTQSGWSGLSLVFIMS